MRALLHAAVAAVCLLAVAAEARVAGERAGNNPPVRVVADQRVMVATAAGQGALPLYLSRDWTQTLPDVTRAVLVIHGHLRNADSYWRSAKKAAAAAGPAAAGALLVVPQFLADRDVDALGLSGDVLHWSLGGWMGGEPAHGPAPLSSFDALDAIVARLSDRAHFPNLREIVVAGHSGGAQVVQRYAVLGHPAVGAGVTLRYVVANPSSYAYFDDVRPVAAGGFAPFAAAACPEFNAWKYGLDRLPPYAPGVAVAGLEGRYASRTVTYLLGQLDTDPNHPALDKTCAAEAEGPYRLARGRAYFAYMQARHAGQLNQSLVEVPGVAHDGRAMLNSPGGLAALFGAP